MGFDESLALTSTDDQAKKPVVSYIIYIYIYVCLFLAKRSWCSLIDKKNLQIRPTSSTWLASKSRYNTAAGRTVCLVFYCHKRLGSVRLGEILVFKVVPRYWGSGIVPQYTVHELPEKIMHINSNSQIRVNIIPGRYLVVIMHVSAPASWWVEFRVLSHAPLAQINKCFPSKKYPTYPYFLRLLGSSN